MAAMIAIERAGTTDLDELVGLFEKYRAFYRCEPSTDGAQRFLGARLEQGDSVVFLARDRSEPEASAVGRAVGFTQLYPLFSSTAMKRLWLLNDLYVEDSHRRKGVARQLIASAAELCRSTGARGFLLETEATNARAQALYESVGMKRVTSFFYALDV